jgi:hypothetical protein
MWSVEISGPSPHFGQGFFELNFRNFVPHSPQFF